MAGHDSMRQSSESCNGATRSADGHDARRILVVDDDEEVCSTLRQLLEREGLGVDVAGSARGAIAAMLERYYELVLLDVHLPAARPIEGGDLPDFAGMDGLDVLTCLNPPERARAVIVVTGLKSAELGARAVRLGARTCLEKPLGRERLLQEVHRGLETPVEGESPDPVVRELQHSFARYGGRERLAERVCRRPRTVSHHVRQVTGRSVPAYVRLLRVESAAWLLTQTHLRVTEIARLVGYNAVEELDRAFRQEKGLSPGEHRRDATHAVHAGDRQL